MPAFPTNRKAGTRNSARSSLRVPVKFGESVFGKFNPYIYYNISITRFLLDPCPIFPHTEDMTATEYVESCPMATCESCDRDFSAPNFMLNRSVICDDCSDAEAPVPTETCIECGDDFQTELYVWVCPKCWENAEPIHDAADDEYDYRMEAVMSYWDDDPSPYNGTCSEC